MFRIDSPPRAILQRGLARLRSSRFVARVTGLGGATVIAQCFGAFALFLLTRFFTPSQIGQYQLFQSTWALIASVSLLSYHSVLPHLDDARYRTLTSALLAFNGFVGLTAIAVLHALHVHLATAIGAQVLAAGFTSIAEMSNIRTQQSGRIAVTRLVLSSANVLWVAVACLVLRTTSLDHVVHGQVTLAVGTGVTYAWFTLRPHSRRSDDGERTPLTTRVRLELVPILVAKKNCALYYAPSELLGSLTLNLPTLLIEHYFGLPLAGQFGVVLRFCGAPVTILSTTIGQVYHGALANAVRERAREAYGNFLRLRRALVGIGIFSGVGIFVVMPFVITLLLGARWRDAANIARGLSPMYAAMIAVGPLTASFQVFEAQRAILLLQIASAAISAISFVFAGILGRFWVGIGLYSALVAVRYLVLLSGISRMSRERLEPFASA